MQEVTVPTDELERSGEGGDLASRHTLMLNVSSIVTLFEIMHRMIPGDDSLVCDAPSRVRMGFGLSRRLIFLASAAAEDACIRKTMLDHEAAHTRALSEAVERFIDRHASDFNPGLTVYFEILFYVSVLWAHDKVLAPHLCRDGGLIRWRRRERLRGCWVAVQPRPPGRPFRPRRSLACAG